MEEKDKEIMTIKKDYKQVIDDLEERVQKLEKFNHKLEEEKMELLSQNKNL